ncbi:serine/threonine-protein kinase [Xanthomonas sp. JAI131]|uniref:serine/threonine-protein kinase n=1 Tax=Xanthomonas sp. JAI131 TaxID=2723067 RepID=UPI0015C9B21A|nr:serine/threonine-protein kinase [Xanthomonas sp. JAI131]NYF22230.1 serine/threonine-protein kinase [Xanthomonas sp. JAI131]
MDALQWQRLSPLLDELLELTPEARAARLAQLHAQDPASADELVRMLALDAAGSDLLSEPLLASAMECLCAGSRIGPYALERLLGEGGMGQVWLAQRADGLYQRQVALKLLRPGYADAALRQRFTREREILARLEHPHLARLLDAGIASDGRPYLALAYVEGEPLTDYCQRLHLPVSARLRLFLQVCEVVSHAHANLIVHRDLKPSNILVNAAGDVRLLDFGIAKLLDTEADPAADAHPRTEARAFTLHYAAPEQVRGEPITTLTDVYSLGVVLYELLTDQKPYHLRRSSDAEWERAILAVEAPRPSAAVVRAAQQGQRDPAEARRLARRLSGDLDNILLKALQKPLPQRYSSAEALAQDLRRHLQGRTVQARPQGVAYRLQKYLQRHRWSVVLGSLTAAALLGAAGVALWQVREAHRETVRAQAMQDFVIGLFDRAGNAQRGDGFDLRGLLASGEQRGERELLRQPLARAELQGVIARLRIGLGDYREALLLLERQRALLATQDDVPLALRLEAAAQHGRALRLLSRSQECVAMLQPLAAQAQEAQAQLPLQAAGFFSQLGRCRRVLGERASARAWFERALALHRDVLKDPAGIVESMTDVASMDSDIGHTDAAIAGYLQALALLDRQAGPRHPLSVNLLRSLGVAYRDRGDVDQAEQAVSAALALSRSLNGDRHPVSLGLRRLRAAVMIDQGRLDIAERELRAAHALTVERLGPTHRDTGMSWSSLAMLELERGQDAQAIADMARSVAIMRAPDSQALLPYMLLNQGLALSAAGRYRDALAPLYEARARWIAQLGQNNPAVGDSERLIAEARAALGEPRQADALLAQALRRTESGYGPTHPRTRAVRVAWARNLGRLGRDAQALHELEAQARQGGDGIESRKLRWRARAYAAELHCQRRGGAGNGRGELQALQRELAQAQPQGGTLVHEVEGLSAACGAPAVLTAAR